MEKLNFRLIRLSYLLQEIANKSTFEIPKETLRKISIIRERIDTLNLNKNLSLARIEELYARIEKLYAECNNSDNKKIRNELFFCIDILYMHFHIYMHFCERSKSSEYNTEDYYKKTISELNGQIKDLKTKLSESKQSNEQKEKIKKELEVRTEQIRQITADKEELEKKLDAQENIKKKITDAFEELKNHTSHLKNEKTRLNWMFYVYAFFSVLVLGLLVYFEWKYLSKWTTPTTLIDYLPFYIPVPIVGGLLWAFIYQMNRAQRQLMLVAYELYHVDYVEGLLLAINMVSPNVASATEKIGNVLDVLVKKHISIPDELLERSLDKEISKDNIDLNTFINIAKEVKGVLK